MVVGTSDKKGQEPQVDRAAAVAAAVVVEVDVVETMHKVVVAVGVVVEEVDKFEMD